LRRELGRIAADERHRAFTGEPEALLAQDLETHHGAAHIIESETAIEEANERSDRARRVVVLGLAEQQGAAPLEIAQVDVVAEARTEDAAAAIAGQYDLGLRIVPRGVGAHADPVAPSDRGQWRRLRENFSVRTDRHFEIL